MSAGILVAVEVNPATPSHAQLGFCSSGDRPAVPMRRCGLSREPALHLGACDLFQHIWGAPSDGCYWRHHPNTKGLPGHTPISNKAFIARPHGVPKLRDKRHEPSDLSETRQPPRQQCYTGTRQISKRRVNPGHQFRGPETPRGSTTRRPSDTKRGPR